MKKLLVWAATGLLTTALLDPVVYAMLDQPIPWLRDLLMLAGGMGCLYVRIRFRHDL